MQSSALNLLGNKSNQIKSWFRPSAPPTTRTMTHFTVQFSSISSRQSGQECFKVSAWKLAWNASTWVLLAAGSMLDGQQAVADYCCPVWLRSPHAQWCTTEQCIAMRLIQQPTAYSGYQLLRTSNCRCTMQSCNRQTCKQNWSVTFMMFSSHSPSTTHIYHLTNCTDIISEWPGDSESTSTMRVNYSVL